MTPFRVYSGRSYSKPAQQLAALGIDPERFAPYLREIKRGVCGVPNVAYGFALIPDGNYGTRDVCAFRVEGDTWHTFYSVLDFGVYLTTFKPEAPENYLIIPDGCLEQAKAVIETLPPGYMIHYPNDDEVYRDMLDFTVERGWRGGDRAHEYEGHKSLSAKVQRFLTQSIASPVIVPKLKF